MNSFSYEKKKKKETEIAYFVFNFLNYNFYANIILCAPKKLFLEKFCNLSRTILILAFLGFFVLFLNDCFDRIFVAAPHQTRLDTRSKARRPIKVGIKGRGRSGTSRDSNPACLCCSSAHSVQCEPDEASSFTNPNMGPGTYAS